MDLGFRASFECEPSKDDPKSANTDFIPRRGPILQTAEDISKLQNTQPGLLQNGNNSCARQELQRLYKSFHLWLQPEKHSKDEIIFQLALEQFMINKHYSEKSTLKEKWEASGGDLEKFTEDLHDDCMKLPDLVSGAFWPLGWGAERSKE